MAAAIQGETGGQAINQAGLREDLFIHAVIVSAVLPRGQRIFQPPFALQHRQAGEGNGQVLFAAVRLLDSHLQIAAAAGRVHVRNFKRARRNVTLVDDIAVLANDHLRIAARDAAHHRRITTQAFRQHVVIGSQLRAAKRHAVKHIGRAAAFAERQQAFQADDIALGVGIDGVPTILRRSPAAGAVVAPGGVVPHSPGAQVEARPQVEVITACALGESIAPLLLLPVKP
ncbi:hypothetical protein AK51_13540 [Serratia nematodiphila DZ0503SBS1]|nr:hypothetical protein AK51_13540 [Serratia nematodiphila DZ0503SBS1]